MKMKKKGWFRPFHAEECCLSLPDMQLSYITFGSGSRNLVMIQGLNTRDIKGAAAGLAYMYRIFAREYKVYLFDRRPKVWEDITVRDMAADISRAMDVLEIKNADIFGVSQGGMIAQYLAIDRPDLVDKLVLAVTLSKNNDTVKRVIGDWITMTEQGDIKSLVMDMAEKMYSDAYVRRYKPFMPLLTVLQKPKDVERFIILAKSCLTCNAYEELDKIQCPVFVIGGCQDKVVGSKASEEIVQKLNCKIYMYEQLGHAAYEEAKDFNKRIYEFLKE
jgi:pimeloyl-ACP methyl ester carboxylesterase